MSTRLQRFDPFPSCACAVAVAALTVGGCFSARGSQGGGETEVPGTRGSSVARSASAAGIALPPGYRIAAVAEQLNMPTGVAFDREGGVFVVEGGYAYGETFDTPRVLRIGTGGQHTVVATGSNPPWNGIVFHEGNFYVSEGGAKEPGRIVRVTPNGELSAVVEGLPSRGDHHTNGPAIGSDGQLYFTQGTRTNSGIVGVDNHEYGWLKRAPELHDVPCRDVKLAGVNFSSANPLTEGDDEVTTGAFVPFGTATQPGQVITGSVPCSGAVLRVPPSGGKPQLVAWGFRNPFGIAFATDGRLFVTDNAYDERGSRPVFGTGDYLWQVAEGGWYGWPDFAGGRPLTAERFKPPGKQTLTAVLAEMPGEPPRPAAEFGVHSSSNGFDFSRNPAFGHVGQAFVAQFGDMAPAVGKVLSPVGFKVVRVDPATGVVTDFATNAEDKGPASAQKKGGLERPIDARFNPAGDALYVVDYGILVMTDKGPSVRKNTGVLWRIERAP